MCYAYHNPIQRLLNTNDKKLTRDWVGDCCLSPKWTIYIQLHVYHDMNKILFDTVMRMYISVIINP
jgi:hypothetical protein